MQCTLGGCSRTFRREDARRHFQKCPARMVNCTASHVGCDHKSAPRDAAHHQENCAHVKLAPQLQQLHARIEYLALQSDESRKQSAAEIQSLQSQLQREREQSQVHLDAARVAETRLLTQSAQLQQVMAELQEHKAMANQMAEAEAEMGEEGRCQFARSRQVEPSEKSTAERTQSQR